jgi:MoCo/4Fe-4S cofactor protein with predicted Tat translocation signal
MSVTGDFENRSALWRSLEELDASPEFRERLHREFPSGASIWEDLDHPLSRRRFLHLLGASAALAGMTACTKMPPEKIIPFVVSPENLVPGIPATYASSCTVSGYAKGILVQSHEGRPTKIEGNPLHPASLGTSDLFMQAELLQMYDPDRSKSVMHLGSLSTWDSFLETLVHEISKWRASGGAGVRILTETITSPSLSADIELFLKRFPGARWHAYEPIHEDHVFDAARLVFGQDLRPLYDFSKANVVLSLDSDFLGPGPTQQAYARQFMSRRKAGAAFNRLYVAESTLSLTGACSDHRLALRPSEIYPLALALAHELGIRELPTLPKPGKAQETWIHEAAKDLRAQAGQALVVASPQSSAEVQALAIAMNEVLGAARKCVSYLAPITQSPVRQSESLDTLVNEMAEGKVSTLIILSANPAYSTPSELRFEEQLQKVPLRIRLGQYLDETSYHCHWHLPESHFLESWGDSRASNGLVSLQQPLISPLYDSRSASELLSMLLDQPGRNDSQALREYWSNRLQGASFDRCVQDGVIPKTESAALHPKAQPGWTRRLAQVKAGDTGAASTVSLEAVLLPDPTIWDGRYANNGWLQELPKPILQLCWDNAALISPGTASQLGLTDEDEVEVSANGKTIRAPILRVPGHPDHSLTLTLGYGRSRAGRVGNHKGYNAYLLQTTASPYKLPAISLKKTGKKWPLALIHSHQTMEGRDIVITSTAAEWKAHGDKIIPENSKSKHRPTLLPEQSDRGNAWAMVIDLTTCIGCKACTIACQAENNIPIVGKDQVRAGREMHWIRVDRYFEGSPSEPKVYFQPVPCMHCEKAPCEIVCPTAATVHSSDGINQMVYNRCVGTRYCSNNCPYKVRRFNFFQYSDTKTRSLQLMYNPDVTVRSRGVMEKCTYCIQRIQEVRINAEKEDRPIRDGEVITACAQACPTDAIVFGDKNDPNSRVAKLKTLTYHYDLLAELGTQPRTSYLAALRNPNPVLRGGA